jgi:hypothetical protein
LKMKFSRSLEIICPTEMHNSKLRQRTATRWRAEYPVLLLRHTLEMGASENIFMANVCKTILACTRDASQSKIPSWISHGAREILTRLIMHRMLHRNSSRKKVINCSSYFSTETLSLWAVIGLAKEQPHGAVTTSVLSIGRWQSPRYKSFYELKATTAPKKLARGNNNDVSPAKLAWGHKKT